MSSFDLATAFSNNAWSVGLALVASYLFYKLITRKRHLPPGPIGLPLLGALHEVKHPNATHLDFDRLGKKYGDIFSLYMGTQLTIVLNSFDAIKEAFSKRDDFSDRFLPGFTDFMDYKSALFQAPYTNEWKENKRFTVQALKNTGFGTPRAEEKIVSEISLLMKYLESQNEAPFDPKMPLQNTFCSVMTSLLLNSNPTWGSKELQRYAQCAEGFNVSLSDAFNLHFINMFLPKFLMKKFCGPLMKRCISGGDNIRDFARDYIKQHRMSYDPDFTRDILDIYQKDGRDTKMGEKVFVNSIVDLLPDGPCTTTEGMNWVLLYLAYYPEVQQVAQKQIDEVCGGRRPTLTDRKALTYTEAIIIETLRLRGPTAFTAPHKVLKDTTLRGYNIPRENTIIMANLYSCHMNPRDFKEPQKFEPFERFIDKDIEKLVDTERVIPFGMGARMCIGAQFVKSILFLMLSHILQRFTLRFPEDQQNPTLEPDFYFFLKPYPYKVCAVPR